MATDAKPKAGLEDVVAGESAICYLDGDRGVLAYQGYDIHDLANAERGASFEETCYLLWHGRLPTRPELGDLQTALAAGRVLPEPIVRATELLLQEGTPRDVALAHPRAEEVKTAATIHDLEAPQVRRLRSAHDATPQAHLLSNGRYAVMLTSAGSGYSRWGDLAVTRWREDVTRDDWGTYVFLRDVQSGDVWSAAFQPTGVAPVHRERTRSRIRDPNEP